MERFLILTNKEKDQGNRVTDKIASYLTEAGKNVTLSGVSPYTRDINSTVTKGSVDCAIVLGGDGTIIQAAYDLMMYDIPILGVNMGTVGFLAEIEEQHVINALDNLINDKYRVESRLMLHGEIQYNHEYNDIPGSTEDSTGFALNDIVITRKGFSRIISLDIYVNDELVDNYRGDGVIISTPTGSTAYNLSAGGPIIIPKAHVMVITPICPHSLSPRSIVVSAEDTIKVVVGKSKKTQEAEAMVNYDGNKVIELGTEDVILVKKAQYDTKLIKLNRTGIYEILRTKLGHNVDG